MNMDLYEKEKLEELRKLVSQYEQATDDTVKHLIIMTLESSAADCVITHSDKLAGLFYAAAADRGHLMSMINAGFCLSGEKKSYYFNMANLHYNEYDSEGKQFIDSFFNSQQT